MQSHRVIFTLTNSIIAFTIIAYLFQININNAGILFGLNLYFIQEALYYQALSTMFMHGGVEHLLMNMIVLWQFGNLIEYSIGKFRFFILYFVGGILTSLGTIVYMYYFEPYGNVVGASGAISALFGYIALRDKTQRVSMIVFIALISFVPLLFGFNIAWYAHIIGFVIGFIFAYFI